MDSLIAQHEALQQCFRFHKAQDALDKAQFLTLFEPDSQITLDFSKHLPHLAVSHVSPEGFWGAIVSALSGFTATHHQLGNTIVELDASLTKASVSAKAIAFHALEQDGVVSSVTAHVNETVDLEKWQGKWVIRRLVVERDVPLDNGGLYLTAHERAERGEGRLDASTSTEEV